MESLILPAEVKQMIEDKKDIFLLDVRSPEEFEDWHIRTAVNIPLQELPSSLLQLSKHKPIITLCAHGHRSMKATLHLSEQNISSKSMNGGMVAWNSVYDIVHVQKNLYQIRRIGKGCLSYLFIKGNKAIAI